MHSTECHSNYCDRIQIPVFVTGDEDEYTSLLVYCAFSWCFDSVSLLTCINSFAPQQSPKVLETSWDLQGPGSSLQ